SRSPPLATALPFTTLFRSAVAHLPDECVQVDDGVADLQWPISPLAHFTEHCVRDPADEIVADVDAVDLREMAADFSVAEAACVRSEEHTSELQSRETLVCR